MRLSAIQTWMVLGVMVLLQVVVIVSVRVPGGSALQYVALDAIELTFVFGRARAFPAPIWAASSVSRLRDRHVKCLDSPRPAPREVQVVIWSRIC